VPPGLLPGCLVSLRRHPQCAKRVADLCGGCVLRSGYYRGPTVQLRAQPASRVTEGLALPDSSAEPEPVERTESKIHV
jgi:hypothetical protein